MHRVRVALTTISWATPLVMNVTFSLMKAAAAAAACPSRCATCSFSHPLHAGAVVKLIWHGLISESIRYHASLCFLHSVSHTASVSRHAY
jgi:hypothetical protein